LGDLFRDTVLSNWDFRRGESQQQKEEEEKKAKFLTITTYCVSLS
jgi:hypothetical protein